ncbi:hypothetical protein [Streptomyces sp. bgisy029]
MESTTIASEEIVHEILVFLPVALMGLLVIAGVIIALVLAKKRTK